MGAGPPLRARSRPRRRSVGQRGASGRGRPRANAAARLRPPAARPRRRGRVGARALPRPRRLGRPTRRDLGRELLVLVDARARRRGRPSRWCRRRAPRSARRRRHPRRPRRSEARLRAGGPDLVVAEVVAADHGHLSGGRLRPVLEGRGKARVGRARSAAGAGVGDGRAGLQVFGQAVAGQREAGRGLRVGRRAGADGAGSAARGGPGPDSAADWASSAPMIRTPSPGGGSGRSSSNSDTRASGARPSRLDRHAAMTAAGRPPPPQGSASVRGLGAQISSSSASLCLSISSISAITSWVRFSRSFSARSRSSSPISPSFWSASSSWRAWRRTLRTATRPSSARCLHHLHELLAALLGELREHQADDRAVVRRVHAEVALLDGLLDGLQRALVVGRDDEDARLGHAEAGELLQRRPRSRSSRPSELLDQRRRGAAGAHRGELRLQVGDGLVHLVGTVVHHHRAHLRRRRRSRRRSVVPGQRRTLLTSVPMRSPCSARRMLPGAVTSNTMIGSSLSMQNVMAVESITFRPFSRISK